MKIDYTSIRGYFNSDLPALKSVQWDKSSFKDIEVRPISLGKTRGTYTANWKYWDWRHGGGNARDRRKRRRAAMRINLRATHA